MSGGSLEAGTCPLEPKPAAPWTAVRPQQQSLPAGEVSLCVLINSGKNNTGMLTERLAEVVVRSIQTPINAKVNIPRVWYVVQETIQLLGPDDVIGGQSMIPWAWIESADTIGI